MSAREPEIVDPFLNAAGLSGENGRVLAERSPNRQPIARFRFTTAALTQALGTQMRSVELHVGVQIDVAKSAGTACSRSPLQI
jgi:hypothetical protein